MNDTQFITGLMRANYEAVGFIPAPAIERQYMTNGRYLVQGARGNPVGYILHGAPRAGGVLTIAQHVIEYDLRQRGFGVDMFRQLRARAEAANCRSIRLHCAADLHSNAFWQAMGFERTAVLTPNNRRQRAINVYVLDLWPSLFAVRPPASASADRR